MTHEVFVPPISVVLARGRDRYLGGLTADREDEANRWIEMFATAAYRRPISRPSPSARWHT